MLPQLQRDHPDPLYRQIEAWMRAQIQNGTWPEHYKLPSEILLAEQFNVNRGTMRNAIQALIKAGLLVRIHGKGTFVAANVLEQPLAESLITFSEGLQDQHIAFDTRVLAQTMITPNAEVARLLDISTQHMVFYLERVRLVNEVPIVYLKNYVVCQGCERIIAHDFEKRLLFDVLEHDYGLNIAWGRRSFEAKATSEVVAQQLHTNPGDPVMYARQIAYLADDRPLELSHLWFRAGRFRVVAILRRGERKSRFSSIIEM